MGAHLEPVAVVAAAVAGAMVAVVMVGGPLWLVVPGALGAFLPSLLGRWREVRGRG